MKHALRHPRGRQDPGRSTLTLETRGRVACPSCEGKGCDECNRRGWMIDPDAVREEFPLAALPSKPLRGD